MKIPYLFLFMAAGLAVQPQLARAQSRECGAVRQQLELGNIPRAQSLLTEILQKNPCHGEALALKGRLQAVADDLPGALAFYEQALKCPGTLPRDIQLEIAMAYSVMDNMPAAIKVLSDYLAQNSTDVEFIHELGLAYLGSGELEAACSWLEKGYRLTPTDLKLATDFGSCLLYKGETDQAVKFLAELVEKNPQAALPNIFLGDAYVVKKAGSQALAAYNRALTLEADNELALFRRARYLQKQGQWAAAQADYQKLLNSGEYQVKALVAMVETSIALGDTKLAQKWLGAAQKYEVLEPTRATIYQAEILRLGGDNQGARKILQDLLSRDGKNELAWRIMLAIGQEENDLKLQEQARENLSKNK